MPFSSQGPHYQIHHWLPAPSAFATEPVRVAAYAPRISIFLHKWRLLVKGVPTLRAEEMSHMPLSTACNDHLAFNRCLAAPTPWTESFVVIQVAVEAQTFIAIVFPRLTDFIRNLQPRGASLDSGDPFSAEGVRFGIECNAFKLLRAVEACKALWVETLAGGADNAARD